MNYINFAKLCRFYALGEETDTTNLADSRLLVLANAAKDYLSEEIAKANEDHFGHILTRDLEADRREYAIPPYVMKMKTVEAYIDGTNLLRLTPFDLNSMKYPTNEASIINYFSGRDPSYDMYRRSIFLYTGSSIIDVTDGLVMRAIVYPADFTAFSSSDDMSKDPSTITFGFPREFHELLARKVSIMYKNSQDKPKALSEQELMFDRDLDRKLSAIKNPNLDNSVIGDMPYDDGSNY